MYRFKTRYQMILLWILCQFSVNFGVRKSSCIWITDARDGDIFLMNLLARSSKVEIHCPMGLHIGVVLPSPTKITMVSKAFNINMYHGKKVKIYLGATTTKDPNGRFPFDGRNTEFSEFLKEHISEDTSIRILITAPCVDLALAIEQSESVTVVDTIQEFFWAGGIYEENKEYFAAYNWKRNISATLAILGIKELRLKSIIVTKNSHPYGLTVNSLSFPLLTQKIANAYDNYNAYKANKRVKHVVAGHWESSIFVATMLMFYPECIKQKHLVEYTLERKESDQNSDADSVIADILREHEMPALQHPKIETPTPNEEPPRKPILYQHLFVKAIHKNEFESIVIKLFTRFIPL
ncbi:unnamed protein product [Albugo candida]|uniref:Inosine/uridine-preferring nucleoside hydrolase domain-containing protein n=1 Tax=Albugo candida TaxID=65357 RepID=A0A024GML8_9STRA|nr:unnamed protein product [Albugo candida]|eukprot:CCI47778.1 unnamed protein product [Albugo candida]